MGQIFEVEGGWKLVVYSYGKRIFSKVFQNGMPEKNRVLTDDYVGELSVAQCNDLLYYGYRNRRGDYVVYRMSDKSRIFILQENLAEKYSEIQLIAWHQKLILFAMYQNMDTGEYEIGGCFLEHGGTQKMDFKDFTLQKTYSQCPQIQFVAIKEALLLVVHESMKEDNRSIKGTYAVVSNANAECYCWERSGDAARLHSEDVWKEYMAKKWEETIQKMHLQEEEKDRMIQRLQQELKEAKSRMEGHQKRCEKLERDIRQKDDILDSVKRQYEELMETAVKYREAAKHWKSKSQKGSTQWKVNLPSTD